MIQDILTYVILAGALIISIYNLIKFLGFGKKEKGKATKCHCDACTFKDIYNPGLSTLINKLK